MNIKYRNKIYRSEDVPVFVYFRSNENRIEFVNILKNYKIGIYHEVRCFHAVIAGKKVIKDKRSSIEFMIEDIAEKKNLQKSLFQQTGDSNAMICSPGDIKQEHLHKWIENNLDELK